MVSTAMTPLEYIKSLGTGNVTHGSGEVFSQHLMDVHKLLESWNMPEPVALAGLYHSIYGTEGFQDFCLSFDRRKDIQAVIGERAEFCAYLNCVMDRASLDNTLDEPSGLHTVAAREEVGGGLFKLTDEQFTDLTTVHLADWLEQVERQASKPDLRHGWEKAGDAWGYRRAAYRRMAELLGGAALLTYEKTFAREPAATRGISQLHTPKYNAAIHGSAQYNSSRVVVN